ncbi:MAG: hypothetical protein IJC54_01610, partial [Clostridia bacterium]|nr:hypothetical protein [Clostridia bacterium]
LQPCAMFPWPRAFFMRGSGGLRPVFAGDDLFHVKHTADMFHVKQSAILRVSPAPHLTEYGACPSCILKHSLL